VDKRTVLISDHAYDQFRDRIQKDLGAGAITQELQSVYRASVSLTPYELAKHRIRPRRNCEYRKCQYARHTGEKVLLILVVSPDKVIVTVIKIGSRPPNPNIKRRPPKSRQAYKSHKPNRRK
jgi:hypothetical protein